MSETKCVFLVLKVIIATLLEMLCLGTHISAKLLLFPKSGIPSRFCRKFWFDHLSWTLGRCGHLAATPAPLPEAEIFQNPDSDRLNPQNMGKSAQLASLERVSLPGLANTGACCLSGFGLSLPSSRADAMKRLECHSWQRDCS